MAFPLRSAIGVFGVVALVACSAHITHAQAVADEKQHRKPILIPGVQEPEEMRVEPLPVHVPTAQERLLGKATNSAGNNQDPAAMLPALNRILEEHPDLSEGYFLRLAILCEGNDRVAILSDINSAIKYPSDSPVGKDSSGSLFSMRAKMEHANGDDAHAMEDLEKAMLANLDNATRFVNSGGTAPEKTASACTWTEPDMDALVQCFPTDYRAYMFRGLYYGFFALYDHDVLKPAIANFRKAAEMNPNSALAHFFSADIRDRAFLFGAGGTEAERDQFQRELLDELNKALALDPKLLPALADRALVYFHLKQWKQAVADYDKILALNPKDAGAYNDRGLAKVQLGNTYEAISDFNKAIENKKRELQQSSSYENRADSYMKTQQWDLAIRDLTTAISLQTGGSLLLWNINEFRALYPEYKTVSDKVIARKLNQTFYPNLKYEDFSKSFLYPEVGLHLTPSFTIQELYLKRSDAYLKSGNWHRAAVEFRRATNGFPKLAEFIDRWREVNSTAKNHVYIDLKTFDDSHNDSVKFWIKISQQSSDTDGPYSLQKHELSCVAKRLRTVSFVNYDASGEVIGRHEGGKWEGIVPDTVGETYLNGICRGH